MNDMATPTNTREQLIKEVFIDPIRTVIVVDDEFPTIDALVSKEIEKATQAAWKAEDLQRVQEILKFARTKDRPWLVDIHDANQIKIASETRIAPYLDHSDLMVLDYHLDGDDGGGDASIQILRQLALNGHHNLVILYTKGYPGEPERALREIAIGLTFPDPDLGKNAEQMTAIRTAIEEWEDVSPGITDLLREEVSTVTYLKQRESSPPSYKSFLASPESEGLKAKLANKPANIKLNLGHLVEWLCSEKQTELQEQFSTIDIGPIQTGMSAESAWLRSDRLFVTVVPKTDPPTVFESRLTNALVDSFPGPQRLLMAKIRAEIDEQGSMAEVAILGDKAVQTAWLDDFLNPSPADESSAILAAINRHWEALGDQMRSGLEPFSARLRTSFMDMEKELVFKGCDLSHTDLGSNTAILNYNRFISTKSFDRSHLTTGHVFRVPSAAQAEASDEYWICLSPACDMVPGQKTGGWNARLGSSLPFIAVRLFYATDQNAAGDATTNNFVFLETNGNTKAYSIYPGQGNVTLNPEWEQMFVSNYGRFQEGAKINIVKTMVNEEGQLIPTETEATVFAQLRAEYALNLLQRMGSFLFRPGLGMHFKKRQ